MYVSTYEIIKHRYHYILQKLNNILQILSSKSFNTNYDLILSYTCCHIIVDCLPNMIFFNTCTVVSINI